MKKLSTTIAVAALSALTLTSCATSKVSSSSAAPAGDSKSQAADAPAAPEKADTALFGSTYTWDDGMQVTVSKPQNFKPSQYAAVMGKQTKFVLFTITVKNGSKQKIDLVGSATAQSGSGEASPVFDSGKGVESAPMTPLLPGRKVSYNAAFGVDDPKDIVLQYGPDFSHENAIFTSK
ncbi:hypothetical protein GCM10009817_39780 [Terrabacter lapilli]|uniref:DUF4352 domain-containing protein n=1 Tax=Terrabacter lapilli TaxID=436231 RepID=A0ABP5E8P2_9MICO